LTFGRVRLSENAVAVRLSRRRPASHFNEKIANPTTHNLAAAIVYPHARFRRHKPTVAAPVDRKILLLFPAAK